MYSVGRRVVHALCLTVASLVFLSRAHAAGQFVRQQVDVSRDVKPLILSASHPRDSLGESVYETQGEAQKQYAPAPGAVVMPISLKLPKPKFPRSLSGKHQAEDGSVEGVITQAGEFIDARATGPVDPDVSAAALDAVRRYRFKPATLDGHPIALLAQVVIHFERR